MLPIQKIKIKKNSIWKKKIQSKKHKYKNYYLSSRTNFYIEFMNK